MFLVIVSLSLYSVSLSTIVSSLSETELSDDKELLISTSSGSYSLFPLLKKSYSVLVINLGFSGAYFYYIIVIFLCRLEFWFKKKFDIVFF